MYLPKVHVEICPANLFSRLFNAFINFSIVKIHISSVHICACSLFFVYSDLRRRYPLCCAVLSCSVVLDPVTPWTAPARLLCPWHSPGKNTGVGCHALLQGILPAQGSDPGLLYCSQVLYWLSHRGSPRILEWVACLISRGSSWPRNQTRVSYIAGIFFTSWVPGKPHYTLYNPRIS